MNIQEILQKFKSFEELSDIRVGVLVLVVAIGSFWLGRETTPAGESKRITVHEREASPEPQNTPLVAPSVGNAPSTTTGTVAGTTTSTGETKEGAYVGSKNGDKYHLPWCSGALRIKEENKVWFRTKEEAEASGYSPASNCKGI
jgi:hypothetical protein